MGQRKIAKNFVDREDTYLYNSIESMSKELSVSIASLSRFVKKLGFENYSAFRKELSNEMLLNLDPSRKMQSYLTQITTENDSIEQQLFKDINTLSKFIQKINHKEVDKAIVEIAKSKSIILMGLGISKSLIYFLDFRLKRMGIQTKLMVNGGVEFIEELTTIGKDDLIITINFKREYREIVLASEFACKNNIRMISLTENTRGEIAKNADIVLEVSRGPHTDLNSLALPVSFCNALLLKVALMKKEEIHGHLDVLNDINKKYFESEE